MTPVGRFVLVELSLGFHNAARAKCQVRSTPFGVRKGASPIRCRVDVVDPSPTEDRLQAFPHRCQPMTLTLTPDQVPRVCTAAASVRRLRSCYGEVGAMDDVAGAS
jgi:hypothetical protein